MLIARLLLFNFIINVDGEEGLVQPECQVKGDTNHGQNNWEEVGVPVLERSIPTWHEDCSYQPTDNQNLQNFLLLDPSFDSKFLGMFIVETLYQVSPTMRKSFMLDQEMINVEQKDQH